MRRPTVLVVVVTLLAAGIGALATAPPVAAAPYAAPPSLLAAGLGGGCSLTNAGGATCWGDNLSGTVGNGTTGDPVLTPVAVTGLSSGVVGVSMHDRTACAVTGAGAAKCWGTNSSGQLGTGNTNDRSNPAAVSGLSSGVASIGVGSGHACAVTVLGALRCWGSNSYGQLGTGNTTDQLTPVPVPAMQSGVRSVTAGGAFTCATKIDNSLWCWGNNGLGQLGIGSTTDALAPTKVAALGTTVRQAAAGEGSVCAVTTAGALRCWGHGDDGQLGDGGRVDRTAPVAVTGMGSGVRQVSVGERHACAVRTNATVACWGHGGAFGAAGVPGGPISGSPTPPPSM